MTDEDMADVWQTKPLTFTADHVSVETMGIMMGAPPSAASAEELFQWLADVEFARFEAAMLEAAKAGHGVICEVYEYETKYFIDPSTPPGYAVSIPVAGRRPE